MVYKQNLAGCEKKYLAPFVVNHYVVWLHIAVHDAFGMTEIQSLSKSNSEMTRCEKENDYYLQKLQHVESDVHIAETRIEDLKVDVVDVFGNKAGNLRQRIPNDIKQCDDIRTTGEVLQNFDLTFDFLLLDRF